jgi:hypothetical protein
MLRCGSVSLLTRPLLFFYGLATYAYQDNVNVIVGCVETVVDNCIEHCVGTQLPLDGKIGNGLGA